MKASALSALIISSATSIGYATAAAVGRAPSAQDGNPHHHHAGAAVARIPTSYESAVQARRILAKTPLATLSTVFPHSSHSSDDDDENEHHVHHFERRPTGLEDVPIGLMDYIADCEDSGNPTILAIRIATTFKNVAAGSNISVALQWTPPHPPAKRIESSSSFLSRVSEHIFGPAAEEEEYDPVPYSAANLPRFSLLGYLEPIESSDDDTELRSCFVDAHPDAKYWLPGNRIHSSEFVRVVVTQIYWIGGFGDRAYIGWIPVEEWQNVTRQEWEDIRLPGEKKGWKEWSADL
ncbi:putative fmn-binding split barrel-related protein [Phaeoacremonium minimum UCRPA7]|uniref:Putative fmn-binding split barrel-related protein n=1 Tax=Phaeoacremonium minimum (strain UCR-PA7) TaxID=1286976 RepID=R8BI94_PHAM7|nr:putative fmn-binding split barrel-related protein [Phaeoacremonium minimum UCRPA7]EON99048.1 putative fmn-binding split barrel-related protein [Phaeoacremonium minimum UCRPA7]